MTPPDNGPFSINSMRYADIIMLFRESRSTDGTHIQEGEWGKGRFLYIKTTFTAIWCKYGKMQLSLGICGGLVPGPPQIPKPLYAQVLYIKQHSIWYNLCCTFYAIVYILPYTLNHVQITYNTWYNASAI